MTPIQVPAKQNADEPELLASIRQVITQNGGWIPFDQYMQMALYTPGLGYYSGSLAKFGAQGDFITAPEMGDLFANCLAAQVAEILKNLEQGALLEFGAGSGALAAGLLNELASLDALPEFYMILDLSGDLRARQQKTIKARAGKHFARVRWLDSLPEHFSGVVIANEVLDAMPVRVFEQDASAAVVEMGVGYGNADIETGESPFCWMPRAADPELAAAVHALDLQLDGASYRSEISFQASAWVQSLGEVLEQGVVLLIDYGFRQAEYYHPDRAQGTLMCHYQHRAHPDPFYKPGQQDITAHVDFTAIALAAKRAGFDLAGYATQGAFLLSSGLLEHIPLDASFKQQLELAQQIKKLTLPHEMGELFKVLALSKNYAFPIRGFKQQNHLNRL
jgi:SAM-dependent MidA family methyltransferase